MENQVIKLTREQMIKDIVDNQLDNIDCYTSFEEACANMIEHGRKGLAELTNEELIDEYISTFSPEEEVQLIGTDIKK